MTRLLIFGLGYSAERIAALAKARGAIVAATTRDGREGTLRFDDRAAVLPARAAATHVLSSVPPEGDADPVLGHYADAFADQWLGYLSSTGVYGDTGGAWVDESAAIGGRRPARAAADLAWLALGARVFRLPGIYGPGRSALDRVRGGDAHRVGGTGVFSRVHVDDLAAGVVAGFAAPAGAYNLADGMPASHDAVIEYAAGLLGVEPPPIVALDQLSPMARGFHRENRRVSAMKARRVLGWVPRFPDYRAGLRSGLRAVSATTSPTAASAAPPTASGVQR